MRLICLGVANGISHTTTGAASSSMAVMDRVTGAPIALIGMGGGVVRSAIQTFGNFTRFPSCLIILSPAVMAYVDLPVYLRIKALQKSVVTVLAPPDVLDRVVSYVEDVLAEEDAAVALAIQQYTNFQDLDLGIPTVIPTPSSSSTPGGDPSSSSSPAVMPSGRGGEAKHNPTTGRKLRNIQSEFDDVVLSQWLIFTSRTKSTVRDDLWRYNAIITHRRVVIDGASKYKGDATAALVNAISTAATLVDAKDVVKEDTTTMIGLVEHMPAADEAEEFRESLNGCDALLLTLTMDETAIRRGLFGATAVPPGDRDDAAATTTLTRRGQPALFLCRYAAHEPPLTFDTQTFIATVGMMYSVAQGGAVQNLGSVLTQQRPEKRKKEVRPATTALDDSTTHHRVNDDINAKQVNDDVDEDDTAAAAVAAGSTSNVGPDRRAGGALNESSASGSPSPPPFLPPAKVAEGASLGSILTLRAASSPRAEADKTSNTQAATPSRLLAVTEGSPYDPEKCPFASALRVEHYDAGASQLAEIQRQLRHTRKGTQGPNVSSEARRGTRQTHTPQTDVRRVAGDASYSLGVTRDDVLHRYPPHFREGVFHCLFLVKDDPQRAPEAITIRRLALPWQFNELQCQGDLFRHCLFASESSSYSRSKSRSRSFEEVLRLVQFREVQISTARQLLDVDPSAQGILEDALSALQSILNEMHTTALALLSSPLAESNDNNSPSGGLHRVKVVKTRAGAHHADLNSERQHLQQQRPTTAMMSAEWMSYIDRWMRNASAPTASPMSWTALDGMPLDGFDAFGEGGDRVEYDIMVSLL